MRGLRLWLATASTAVAVLLGLGVPAGAGAETGTLEQYQATVSQDRIGALNAAGYDIAAVRGEGGPESVVDLVLSEGERRQLRRDGIATTLLRDPQGRTVSQRAAMQAKGGYRVFDDYDGRGGIAAQLRRIAKRYPGIAKLRRIGRTIEGRRILAIRLAARSHRGNGGGKAGGRDDGSARPGGKRASKPTVLYQGTTHAREWISTELTMRALDFFIGRRNTKDGRRLLRSRELWFVPVVNPDGYQFTFDHERLWRKNLRDNDGDGEITLGDGVDLNRNYPERWNYDDEGSASIPSDETFRGTGPASEPETQADVRLVKRIDPAFAVSYHSYGPLLLYPQGWQVQTPTADDPIYAALSGTELLPAIKGFDPDLAAELYTTNGEFTDWAHSEQGVLAWTPELNEGCDGCGFVFPDNERKVAREFAINRPFITDLARSAANPAKPKSHTGNRTSPFYLDTVEGDRTRAHNPDSDFRFPFSYGSPQQVQVLARKGIGDVRAEYTVNGGPTKALPAKQVKPGERFGLNDYGRYYHELRAEIPEGAAGDTVEVSFAAGRRLHSPSFSYEVLEDDPADVLIVAAEDYTGTSSDPPPPTTAGPSYVASIEAALDAAGRSHDVYDVDSRGRIAPDALGVLGHYDAVVWETGNDMITAEPDTLEDAASRLANDEMLELRSYLNEGGKLLFSGQYAGFQYANALPYDPVANRPCGGEDPSINARCLPLSDDFLQYYLGAGTYNDDAGTEAGAPLGVVGTGAPFAGLTFGLNGPGSARNQVHTASFLSTSSLLPEADYPQFAGSAPAAFARAGAAPYEPFEGSSYMFSDRASQSYKRLSHVLDLRAVTPGNARLSFRTSYDTERDYDHVIVEVHRIGQDDWTTLPDLNGHTTTDPGASCEDGWSEDPHPFLSHYVTVAADGGCTPTGTTGSWNSATGRSAGWEPWRVDLSAYAGARIEVSISYVSDASVQGIGQFVDAISTPDGQATTSFEDDADPMDGWQVPGPPEGSPENANDWRRTGSLGYEEGAVVSTPDTLYFGFGIEGIKGAEARADVMRRSMNYLLGG